MTQKEERAVSGPQVPRDGFATQVKVIGALDDDGDTIEVEVSRRFRVRLVHDTEKSSLIFDTPEKSTHFGKLVQKYVGELLKNFKGVIRVFVPTKRPMNLMDICSFERILGEIWLDNKRLTDILLEKGYARIVPRSQRTKIPWVEVNIPEEG